MTEYKTIKEFFHFIDWYEGELTLIKNKAYDNGVLVAKWVQQ